MNFDLNLIQNCNMPSLQKNITVKNHDKRFNLPSKGWFYHCTLCSKPTHHENKICNTCRRNEQMKKAVSKIKNT